MEWIAKLMRKQPRRGEGQGRAELDRRAAEAAKKAVRDYRRVFERLAEYDRT